MENETDFDEYLNDYEEEQVISDIKYTVDVNRILIDKQSKYNNMLNAEVELRLDEKVVAGRVKQQLLVPEVKIVGRYDDNHMMNSMIYEVDFPDGKLKDYVENFIPKNMLSQVDDERYIVTLLNSVVD